MPAILLIIKSRAANNDKTPLIPLPPSRLYQIAHRLQVSGFCNANCREVGICADIDICWIRTP